MEVVAKKKIVVSFLSRVCVVLVTCRCASRVDFHAF